MFNILIIGSGGREHAIAKSISKSQLPHQIFALPGNPGIATFAKLLTSSIQDFTAIIDHIHNHKIHIVICGPEAPLAEGLMDFILAKMGEDAPILIGPKQFAAQLESSKNFAKEFMQRHQIPTAAYQKFTIENLLEGIQFIEQLNIPIVLKADGLAAGKGVLICQEKAEAKKELEKMLQGKFGSASKLVVIEEFLKGIEFSVFVLTDGEDYVLLPEAKDYKRIGEGDTGLNTGGMGAISPVSFFNDELKEKVISKIIEPTIQGLKKEKIDYCGFLFLGLIVVEGEPFVIEYNVRMGDPESESVFSRIDSDLLELFLRCRTHQLATAEIKINPDYCTTVILASGGYPEDFEKSKKIIIPSIEDSNITVFHCGTREENNTLLSNGGRVLAISSMGQNKEIALERCRHLANEIQYEGKYFRRDIGFDVN